MPPVNGKRGVGLCHNRVDSKFRSLRFFVPCCRNQFSLPRFYHCRYVDRSSKPGISTDVIQGKFMQRELKSALIVVATTVLFSIGCYRILESDSYVAGISALAAVIAAVVVTSLTLHFFSWSRFKKSAMSPETVTYQDNRLIEPAVESYGLFGSLGASAASFVLAASLVCSPNTPVRRSVNDGSNPNQLPHSNMVARSS